MLTPVKVWSVARTGYDEHFPEEIEMVWLGNQQLLLMSREDGWHLLDISTRLTAEVVAEDSLPPLIEEGGTLGETSIYPNETARALINAFIRGEDSFSELPTGARITRGTVPPVPVGTLLVDVRQMSLMVTTWALSSYVECLVKHHSPPDPRFTDVLYPSVWNVDINDEPAGIFISHIAPLVVREDKWYICIQRHDFGIDIYRLD